MERRWLPRTVILAKARIQSLPRAKAADCQPGSVKLDSRFRENDGVGLTPGILKCNSPGSQPLNG
jgi:hypothetical protein